MENHFVKYETRPVGGGDRYFQKVTRRIEILRPDERFDHGVTAARKSLPPWVFTLTLSAALLPAQPASPLSHPARNQHDHVSFAERR